MGRSITLLLVLLVGVLLQQCTRISSLSGTSSGSETTNGYVTGSIAKSDGTIASHVQVMLIPSMYNPVRDKPITSPMIDTTDDSGTFHFIVADSGSFMMEGVHIADRTRLLLTGITVKHDTVRVPRGILGGCGVVKIMLSDDIDKKLEYFYIAGTTAFSFLNGGSAYALLDSIPAGIIPTVNYATTTGTASEVVRYSITIEQGDTTIIENPQWKYSRALHLNTSASGADVSGSVYDFPVVIRLNSALFDFSKAQADGRDIRFTKADNVFLPYEIERWDAVNQQAEIWVKVDTVHGGDSDQAIMMYWGNDKAADFSSGAAVFDTEAGFQGVWHLNETGNDPALDATANGYNGMAYHMSADPSIGVIGKARAFDGDSSYITMPNTASGKLNFPEDGIFTISAWVYADTLDSTYRTIAGKGHQQYFLQLTFFPGNKPWWEFSNFRETSKWNMSTSTATGKQWVLLTGVVQGSSQYLYCNGELVADTTTNYSQNVSRDASDDFAIGRFFKKAGIPIYEYCYFKGKIDEVSVSSIARNRDWIRLCYMNQRSDDKLVQFK
jgi:hypothetical protein